MKHFKITAGSHVLYVPESRAVFHGSGVTIVEGHESYEWTGLTNVQVLDAEDVAIEVQRQIGAL